VEVAGDWLDPARLPDTSAVENQSTGGGVQALEFDAKELGRSDSALMVRVLAMHDLCTKAKVEFRAQTLPEGLTKLIVLSQAVPVRCHAA